MGQSTDAYLFFGITATEEVEEEEIAEKLGIELDDEHWDPINQKLPEGIKLIEHCSMEYLIPAIIISQTHLTANRGYPKRFENLPELDSRLVDLLKEYAKKLGWKEPSWMIASMWR